MKCMVRWLFAARAWAALAAALAMTSPGAALAQLTLVYSFEDDPQGFAPNGGGVELSIDTIGATEGMASLKMEVVQGATFVGALTQQLPPEIGDPPGVDVVAFDLTITEAFPNTPGNFVDAGITVFGASQPGSGQQFGLQAQFLGNQVSLGALAPGTYPIQMMLTKATHPLTFAANQSFNQIFGVEGSGPNDLIPTGLQIYINKSNTAPWTGYIDNIRVGMLPPIDANFNDDALVDAADLTIWRGAFAPTGAAGDADGDGDADGTDFLIWQRQLATPGGGALAATVSSVPEPATAALAAVAAMALVRRRRQVGQHVDASRPR